LARILVSPSNFLLLDEPTNHLDMRAKDVLLEAIAAFSGTVVFVSHDRYFIDRLATRVLEVEGGTVTSHEGNYEDYLRRKEAQVAGVPADKKPVILSDRTLSNAKGERVEGPASHSQTVPAQSDDSARSNGAANDRPRRLNPIKQKQMEERCAFLEEETPRVEAAIAHTEQQLAVFVSASETARLSALADDLRTQLSALTVEWEDLMMQLEEQGAPS
jgi:ATP-binding cassette subfamily F protein 3